MNVTADVDIDIDIEWNVSSLDVNIADIEWNVTADVDINVIEH